MRFLLVGLLWIVAWGSQAQTRISHVRVQVNANAEIEILYDLSEARPGDSIFVRLDSRLRGELAIRPEWLRGDVGTRVMAGADKRIVWNALRNDYPLDEDIRATVSLITLLPTASAKPAPAVTANPSATTVTEPVSTTFQTPTAQTPTTPKPQRVPGPGWALVSLVAPGIGNMFVQTPTPKVGFRPALTVATYSLAVFGFLERQKAQDAYALYNQQKNAQRAESYYQDANLHHHRYFAATRAAMALTAMDVVLTFIRGINNEVRARRSAATLQLHPGVQAGQPVAKLRYTF